MAWKKATAYKILDRVIIMPVFLIPDLYPVSGDPVFDGLAKDPGISDAVLKALYLSQTAPSDYRMDLTNQEFLRAVRLKSLKEFHKMADSIAIEAKTSPIGEDIWFQPLARSQRGGFETSTFEGLSAPSEDRQKIQDAFVAAFEQAIVAEPKPKPILPFRTRRRPVTKPKFDA